MKMTETQARRAFALAKSHGHAWAIEENKGVLDIDSIEENSRRFAYGPNDVRGIEKPEPEGMWITHTTGTGRLKWRIHVSGHVELRISRPGHVYVIAIDVTEPEAEESQKIHVHVVREWARQRHADAAQEALQALADAEPDGFAFRHASDLVWQGTIIEPTDDRLWCYVRQYWDKMSTSAKSQMYDLVAPYVIADYFPQPLPEFTPAPGPGDIADISRYLDPAYSQQLLDEPPLPLRSPEA